MNRDGFLKRIVSFLLVVFLFCCGSSALAAPVTSPFGWRIHPITGEWAFHSGVDIGYEYGTDIVAMLPGRVVYAAEWGGYGSCMVTVLKFMSLMEIMWNKVRSLQLLVLPEILPALIFIWNGGITVNIAIL